MSGIAHDFDDSDLDGPLTVLSFEDAQEEDHHWSNAHRREQYYQPHYDYEDYAPAYCVGYIGHAQYGGTFEDAERSLCANWLRIKGGSRLSLEEAMPAIRAAWDRAARMDDPVDEPMIAPTEYVRETAAPATGAAVPAFA